MKKQLCPPIYRAFHAPNISARFSLPAEVNRLSNQVLVTTYEREWGRVMAR
jgi:hypothetical protein